MVVAPRAGRTQMFVSRWMWKPPVPTTSSRMVPRPAPVAVSVVNGSACAPCASVAARRFSPEMARGPSTENVTACSPAREFQVLQQQRQPRLVAGRQEPRQQRFGDQRVTHVDVGRGGAQAGAEPGHRHQPHLAVEVGHIERELGDAVGARLHRRDEQRDGLLGDVGQHEAALVAALAKRGRGTVGRRDQPAPVVADIEAQLAPAEEVVGRIGRDEAGQAQDALVHRREADPGAGRGADADHGARSRRVFVRHVERDRQLARRPDRCRPRRGRWRGRGAISRRRRCGTRAP